MVGYFRYFMYHGYGLTIEWSDENHCYVGTCPELSFGYIHGDFPDKLEEELKDMVEETMGQEKE